MKQPFCSFADVLHFSGAVFSLLSPARSQLDHLRFLIGSRALPQFDPLHGNLSPARQVCVDDLLAVVDAVSADRSYHRCSGTSLRHTDYPCTPQIASLDAAESDLSHDLIPGPAEVPTHPQLAPGAADDGLVQVIPTFTQTLPQQRLQTAMDRDIQQGVCLRLLHGDEHPAV